MELRYQQKWSIIGTKLVVLWLTAVGALTPHFVVETSAIDNAKAPNIIICTCYLLITFLSSVALLWKYHERDGSFLSQQRYSKRRRADYLFIYLFFAVTYFCWSVDVFVVIVVVAVCLFVFLCFLCFILPPGFKQALHNKPPTHLGGNDSRIVIQPRDNCHNRDWGTSDN